MTFIIKPIVTEKMTKVTEKSSADKKVVVPANRAEAKGATEEKISYTVKKNGQEIKKEKTVYSYTKPAQAKYGFLVKPEANKLQIKAEIEARYNVTVEDVNTMNYAGKRSARYTKAGLIKGQKNDAKKAIVTLKAGEEIDFYSNI